MPATNEEKYLKSIDGTLKDILKELKRQGKNDSINAEIKLDGKVIAAEVLDMSRRKDRLKALGHNKPI